jgi:cytochrome c-type biogenesis protein CcmE
MAAGGNTIEQSTTLHSMSPTRRRRARLIAALSCALLLASGLVYTSFTSASPARSPSQLLAQARSGVTYQLTGNVAPGTIRRSGATLTFGVRDHRGRGLVTVAYRGTVPDAFRPGREIIVSVQRDGSRFAGVRDSLITKCPSKYTARQG